MAARMAERWYGRLSHAARPRAARPPAADPLRQRSPLPPDQHHPGGDRRRDRRRDRSLQAAHRPAVCRPARGDRPRARPRADPRLPVRHHRHERELEHRRRAGAAAVVHRGNGGVPVDRSGRSAHRDVDARRGAARERCRRSTTSTTRATSRIATATRCGPSSAASTATRRSGRCCAPARSPETTSEAFQARARRRHQGADASCGTRRSSRPIVRSPKPPSSPAQFSRPVIVNENAAAAS